MMRDIDEADDLMQRVAMKAWRYRASFTVRQDVGAKSWVRTILAREAASMFAERGRRAQISEAAYCDPTGSRSTTHDRESEIDMAAEVESILADIEALPTEYADTLECRLAGLTTRETADLLDIAHGTVMSRTHRAIKALRAAA